MSYVKLNPSYYQMNNPEGPWHAGAPGWSTAPWPSWGINPAQVGPKRLGVEGLGLDITLTDKAASCSPDRATGVLIGIAIGGGIVGLGAFLLSR